MVVWRRYSATVKPSLVRAFASSVQVSEAYSILSVNPSASAAQIKSAFYNLAKKCHPDALGQLECNSTNKQTQAADQFRRASEAYRVLTQLRQKSDDKGNGSSSKIHESREFSGAARASSASKERPKCGSGEVNGARGRDAAATAGWIDRDAFSRYQQAAWRAGAGAAAAAGGHGAFGRQELKHPQGDQGYRETDRAHRSQGSWTTAPGKRPRSEFVWEPDESGNHGSNDSSRHAKGRSQNSRMTSQELDEIWKAYSQPTRSEVTRNNRGKGKPWRVDYEEFPFWGSSLNDDETEARGEFWDLGVADFYDDVGLSGAARRQHGKGDSKHRGTRRPDLDARFDLYDLAVDDRSENRRKIPRGLRAMSKTERSRFCKELLKHIQVTPTPENLALLRKLGIASINPRGSQHQDHVQSNGAADRVQPSAARGSSHHPHVTQAGSSDSRFEREPVTMDGSGPGPAPLCNSPDSADTADEPYYVYNFATGNFESAMAGTPKASRSSAQQAAPDAVTHTDQRTSGGIGAVEPVKIYTVASMELEQTTGPAAWRSRNPQPIMQSHRRDGAAAISSNANHVEDHFFLDRTEALDWISKFGNQRRIYALFCNGTLDANFLWRSGWIESSSAA